MARFQQAAAILDAVEQWRQRCLVEDGSVFTQENLWTLGNLEQLDRFFIQNPDDRDVSFLTKFESQLAPTPPQVKRLAAEMLWMMYLVVSGEAMGAETKEHQIRTVWSWSGENLPADHELLGDLLARGVSHTGTGYNTHRWRELRFFITTMEDWKRLDRDRRVELLSDPWTFADWLERREWASGRQLRHILLFLVFPDHFEPIATASHKRRIVRSFRAGWDEDPQDFDYDDRVALDREVLRIRGRLAEEFPDLEELDFHRDPLQPRWRQEGVAEPVPRVGALGDPEEARRWLAGRFGDHAVWCIGTGGGGRLWDEFADQEIVAIPWDYLGDLTEYGSRDEVQRAIAEQKGLENPTNDSLAAWQFGHEMKPGDVVIAKQGNSRLFGWGRIKGEYVFEPSRPEYAHLRPVEWEKTGSWEIPRERNVTPKTLTNFDPYPSWLRWAFELMEDGGPPPPEESDDGYPLTEAVRGLFLDPAEFSMILDVLARRRNVILQGPPGVGKTFIARRLAYALIGRKAPERLQVVQFHQSYAYEDFVQGWRPSKEGGFVLRDGVFHQFCRRAAEGHDDEPHVFVIDEINRGNLSRIFGELLMLIESDKRGREHAIPLTYSGSETFFVPRNVHLVGLMNTADRSLALVDYALRRRFGFIDMEPAFGKERFTEYLLQAEVPDHLVRRINDRMEVLNTAIRSDRRNLGPGFEVGHSFFVPSGDEENLDETWYLAVVDTEIAPLLREYWFDQPDRVDEQLARLRS